MNDLLFSVDRVIGDKNIEKWAHYHTYLVAKSHPKATEYNKYIQDQIQSPHKDFRENDLKGHEGKYYICFIPLTIYGMPLTVYDRKHGQVFEFEYGNLYVISADTVHAGGFCTDEHEGNLRLQLHITIDAKNHPLPIEGYQQKVLENVDYELNENAVSVSKLN